MSRKTPVPTPRKRGRRPVGPQLRRGELERLYVTEGLTVAEIAERLGTTRPRAMGMLQRAGIPRRPRGPRPLIPPSERERRRLERLYVSEGLTVSEIARRLGTTRDQAEGILRRAGLRKRPFRAQLPPADELAHLYTEENLSTRDLARRFGVHQATIWRALADAGIDRRPVGSGNRPKWPERIDPRTLEDLYVTRMLPIPEVARRLGVGESSVSKALHGYGIAVDGSRAHRRRPSRKVLVELYVNQGLSTAELARHFGVHRRTPWHWIADAGITRRPGRGVRADQPPKPEMIEAPELLTPGQAAEVLGVDPKTVSRWAREGRITAERTTPGGHRRFSQAEVARLARRGAST